MKTSIKYLSGLDIQSDYMCIAQYSPQDNAVLSVAIQPFSDQNGDDIWQSAEQELKKLKGKFKFYSPDINCSLPTEHAVIKHIQIDSGETDLDSLIEWELSQQITGSMDEYSFDYQKKDQQNKNSTIEFLTVAFRNVLIERYSSILKTLKLHPQVIDLDAFAIINTFEANYRERIDTPAVIVHGESGKTKVILTRNGMYIDMECFNYSLEDINPLSYSERLKAELNRFLSLNNKVDIQPKVALYLTGSLFTQLEYRDSVYTIMGCGELLYPFRNVGCRIAIDNDQLMTYAPQLAVAVGLAIRGNE